MLQSRRASCTLFAVLALALSSTVVHVAGQKANETRKPSLSLKATPPMGMSPLAVQVSVDIRDGSDEELYCPSIQWEWGDDATSERSEDCNPYVAGTSEITRRYRSDHTYREPGSYRMTFRLKQKDRVIVSGSTNIEVRPGFRDDFGF